MTFHPDSLPDLSGKVYIVTGANTGMGYYDALNLAKHGARVYLGARSQSKGDAALQSIKEVHPTADVHLLLMDHTSLATIKSAVSTFLARETALHGLINNAGIMTVPFSLTKDGHEIEWQTNYLAHWLLTDLLLPTLLETSKKSAKGEVRIVNMTSGAHWLAPKGGIELDDPDMKEAGRKGTVAKWGPYGQSKLANVLHAKTLHERFGPGSESAKAGKGEIWAVAVHPGLVDTQLLSNVDYKQGISWPVMKFFGQTRTPDIACYTPLFAAASKDFPSDWSGKYLVPVCQTGWSSGKAKDLQLAKKLEEYTQGVMRSEKWIE